MTTLNVGLSPDAVLHFDDSNGNPLVGGLLFTYAAGTTTKQNSYTDSTAATPNTNPIVLNSRGECQCWLDTSLWYKVVLAPAGDTDPPSNAIWTVDQVQGINIPPTMLSFATLAALRVNTKTNVTTAVVMGYYQAGDGGGGIFTWSASSSAADDGGSVIMPTGWVGSGRWLRVFSDGFNSIQYWGAQPSASALVNTAAINAAIAYGAANGFTTTIDGGTYPTVGNIYTPTGTHLRWEGNSWLTPQPSGGTSWTNQSTTTGGIIGPFLALGGAVQAVSDITIENPRLDLTAVTGENAIGYASAAPGTNPTRITILGGFIKRCYAQPSPPTGVGAGWGFGGKAVIFEQGISDALILGLRAEDCFCAVEVQGIAHPSTGTNDSTLSTPLITIDSLTADCCQVALLLGGGSGSSSYPPVADASVMGVLVRNLYFHNCGHLIDPAAQSTDYKTMKSKSGAIVLFNARNCSIQGKGYNDPAYPGSTLLAHSAVVGPSYAPGYPALGAWLTNDGMSGPIGAVIWGWGRNISIDMEYHGAADAGIVFKRAYQLRDGGVSGSGSQADYISNLLEWDVKLRIHGAVDHMVRTELPPSMLGDTARAGSGASTLYMATATASDSAADYVGRHVWITAGTGNASDGAGAGIYIKSYDATAKIATVSPNWPVTPDGTSVYQIGGIIAPSPTDISGTATGGSSSTIILAASTGGTSSSVQYVGRTITTTGGAGSGQTVTISAISDPGAGTGITATCAWSVAVNNTTTYTISATDLTGRFLIDASTVNQELVHQSMANFAGATMKLGCIDGSVQATGRATDIYNNANQFSQITAPHANYEQAAYSLVQRAGTFNTSRISVTSNTITGAIPLQAAYGLLAMSCSNKSFYGLFQYYSVTGPACNLIAPSSLTNLQAFAKTGTPLIGDCNANSLMIAVDNLGNLYIANKTGADVTVSYMLIGR